MYGIVEDDERFMSHMKIVIVIITLFFHLANVSVSGFLENVTNFLQESYIYTYIHKYIYIYNFFPISLGFHDYQ